MICFPVHRICRPQCDARRMWDNRDQARPSVNAKTAERVCDLISLVTAAAFAVPVGELTSRTRGAPSTAFARQTAMYLAHVTLGLTYSQVGRAFGRDRTTAAYACQLIEERRDDPNVDAIINVLEHACGALRQRLSAPAAAQPMVRQ